MKYLQLSWGASFNEAFIFFCCHSSWNSDPCSAGSCWMPTFSKAWILAWASSSLTGTHRNNINWHQQQRPGCSRLTFFPTSRGDSSSSSWTSMNMWVWSLFTSHRKTTHMGLGVNLKVLRTAWQPQGEVLYPCLGTHLWVGKTVMHQVIVTFEFLGSSKIWCRTSTAGQLLQSSKFRPGPLIFPDALGGADVRKMAFCRHQLPNLHQLNPKMSNLTEKGICLNICLTCFATKSGSCRYLKSVQPV